MDGKDILQDTLIRLEGLFRDNSFVTEEYDLFESDLEILKKPKRSIIVHFPIKTKKGIKIIEAYRVQYNDALGPTKGGIRFHPKVDKEEVSALAFWMTLKNSLLELPYGGAKGGLAIDSKEFSEDEIEAISREYIRQIHPLIGPYKDIPAPDVYTTPQIMGWMMDEFSKIKGEHQPGVITGKPLSIGGSKVRDYSTALGGFFVLREAMIVFDLDPFTSKVAIQGFGNAGMNMARILFENDYKIMAVSDSKTAIYNPEGLDITKVIQHKKETGSVLDYTGAKNISNEELLMLDVDILVPAALSGVINEENASRIKARIVLELANGPVTREADKILIKNDVIVLPDILANAGGVTVSYFEWIQNLTGDYWEEKVILKKLDNKMSSTFHKLHEDYVKKKGLDFRCAAYIRASQRILRAEKDRGRL